MTLSRRHFLHSTFAAAGAATLGAQGPAPIRIGQLGTGHAHASGKYATLRKSPEFEFVGICEPDAELRRAAEKSKAYEGARWLAEEQLLAVPGLRAVAVETPVRDLLPTAHRCVAAGFHVHLDKPAGESLPELRRLLEEATRRRLVVQMGYMFRYHPAFQLCAKLVREGALGDIFSIETAMSKQMSTSALAPLLPYPGGAMFELGCHVIDAVVALLGRPAKVTPYSRPAPSGTSDFPVNQVAVFEYPKAMATVRSALLQVDGGSQRKFVVCGTRGTFEINPLEPAKVRLALDAPAAGYAKGEQEVALPKTAGRYDGDFADLAAVLKGEHPLAWSPEHDLAVQETVLLASGLPII